MSRAFLHKQTTNKQTPSRLVVRVIHVRRRRRPTSAHPAFVLDLANKKKRKKRREEQVSFFLLLLVPR